MTMRWNFGSSSRCLHVAHTRLAEGFDGLCKLPELSFSDELCRAVGRGDLQEQAQRKHLLKVMQRGFKMRA
jgi:hypothetical protein